MVASSVGGLQYTVREGLNGHLVEPKDPDALGKALVAVLNGSSGVSEAVKVFAAHQLKEEFYWPSIGKQMQDMYGTTIAARMEGL